MILVAATTKLQLSFKVGKFEINIGKEVASAEKIRSIVEPMAETVKKCVSRGDPETT